jgi:hypothetical protein
MNCFECSIESASSTSTAIALCASCGAGLCRDHAHLVILRPPTPSEWTRTITGARRIVCPSCYAYPPAEGEPIGLVPPHGAARAKAA